MLYWSQGDCWFCAVWLKSLSNLKRCGRCFVYQEFNSFFLNYLIEWCFQDLSKGLHVATSFIWTVSFHSLTQTKPAAAAAKSLQSCPTLCDPIDGSPPGSPVPGILQARTLEWVSISFFNAWNWKVKVKVKLRSPVRLFATPMDCSLPGSSVNGIFQARVLEWDAKPTSI